METPCGAHTAEIINLQKDNSNQWVAINHQRNRLDELMKKWIPVWVAFLLMVMSGVAASALTIATMVIKYSGK
jgi:hypothetical protein